MTIQYSDVLRHEDSTAQLPSTSRNMQTTYETDLQRRQRHATSDGSTNYWTPDEKFNASIPAYTNALAPSVTTVKGMLDFLASSIYLPGSTSILAVRLYLSGSIVKMQKSTDNFTTWTDTGNEWGI